jgi:arginine decarboxylase
MTLPTAALRDRALVLGLKSAPLARGTVGSMGLEIWVTTGIGEARTPLAAFDRALFDAGIGNYNLIVLSSVIPIGATVVRKKWQGCDEQWGDRLYVVLAEHRSDAVGQEAWAGLGWVQSEGDGRGLFVEHHGVSRQQVEDHIEASLASMCAYRRDSFTSPQMAVAGTVCTGDPVCAVAAAVYEAHAWDQT